MTVKAIIREGETFQRLEVNGQYTASIWGVAKVEYHPDLKQYYVMVGGGRGFMWVNEVVEEKARRS